MKMYLTAIAKNQSIKNAWAKLLKLYDLLSVHFDFKNVDRINFRKLKKRFRNDKKKSKLRSFKLIENEFVSLNSSSLKTRKDTEDSSDKKDAIVSDDDISEDWSRSRVTRLYRDYFTTYTANLLLCDILCCINELKDELLSFYMKLFAVYNK